RLAGGRGRRRWRRARVVGQRHRLAGRHEPAHHALGGPPRHGLLGGTGGVQPLPRPLRRDRGPPLARPPHPGHPRRAGPPPPAAGQVPPRPPWSPRALTSTEEASARPGADCSPGPLTTYRAPSIHRHQTGYGRPPSTASHTTAAFFMTSSTSTGMEVTVAARGATGRRSPRSRTGTP